MIHPAFLFLKNRFNICFSLEFYINIVYHINVAKIIFKG